MRAKFLWLPGLMLALLSSCAVGGTVLRTGVVQGDIPDSGAVRLLLYDGNSPDDPRKLGIIDLKDDWEITPWGAAKLFRAFHADSTAEAVETAVSFLKSHRSAIGTETRAIFAPDGTAIGYEFRPRYQPIDLGQTDVLSVVYRPDKSAEGRILVYVDLKESVRDLMEGRKK